MIEDLSIMETGSGGDLILQGNNLSTTKSWFNMPYLAMFGGNVEQLTPSDRPDGEQQFDWWGNSLLFPDNTNIQYNSRTEKALRDTALNSAGRIKIEQAIKKDLAFMSAFAEVEVSVTIEGVDRVRIRLNVMELEAQTSYQFIYLWDGAKIEEINQTTVGNVTAPLVWLLEGGVWEDEGYWVDEETWKD